MPFARRSLFTTAFAMVLAAALPTAVQAAPIISEFMASNSTTIADQDGDYADWVELFNPDAVPENLAGWYLTNKASKLKLWEIPAGVTLAPGAYLLVFCSSKNYTNPSAPLATNFNLPASGGYVGLVAPDGATVASSYTYPVQYPDVSYGVSQPAAANEAPQLGYFETATPGEANGGHGNLLLADSATVSNSGGAFLGSLSVTLAGAGPTEHIRYVVAPASASGDSVAAPTAASPLYTGPLSITSSGLLRAAVFSADDSQRGLPVTAMYVQLDASSSNRVDTFTSNLPLLLVDNNGFGPLPDNDAYYPGAVGAYSPGASGASSLTPAPDFFTADATKLHGSSSATWPKQSFDLDLSDGLGQDVDVPFFGLDTDSDWVAVSPWYYDRTFVRNAVVYGIGRSLGYWAPQSQPAEMFDHSGGGILDTASYAGVTNITDRLKVGANRINIYSLSPSDVTAPNLTGGYILRIDHAESDLYSWTTSQNVTVMIDTPKLDALVQPQVSYITSYVQQMEDAMVGDQGSGYATHNYLNYLDRPSWVDYHLINVLVENVDAFQYSEYFTKDVNGLIKAGPLWDYDRCMGSADGRDVNPLQWNCYNDVDFWNVGWWQYLTHDPDFMQAWVDRWQTLRLAQLSDASLGSLVTSMAARVGPAVAARDAAKFPDDQGRFGDGWAGEVSYLQNWLTARADWIDSQFVGAPTVTSGGVVTVVPPTGASVAYTLDGSDPRLSGGALSPTAKVLDGALTLPAGQVFLARSYNASLVGVYPGSPWSSPVSAASASAARSGHLSNVSIRAQVASSGAILGFSLSGPSGAANQVLMRGVGPTLSQYGVSGVLTRPVLTVYNSSGNMLSSNAGWCNNPDASAVQAAAADVGAFSLPQNSADSALLISLAPGVYTMGLNGQGQSTGVALGEIYQMAGNCCQLLNVSSLDSTSNNSGTLTSGFVIIGGTAQVLIRGVGPTLAAYGVSNVLGQPTISVLDSADRVVATNTGWGTNPNAAQIAATAASVGAFTLPSGSADCAVLVNLPAGTYTVEVSGVGGASGNALAECYLVQ